jgi:hypothetical protein
MSSKGLTPNPALVSPHGRALDSSFDSATAEDTEMDLEKRPNDNVCIDLTFDSDDDMEGSNFGKGDNAVRIKVENDDNDDCDDAEDDVDGDDDGDTEDVDVDVAEDDEDGDADHDDDDDGDYEDEDAVDAEDGDDEDVNGDDVDVDSDDEHDDDDEDEEPIIERYFARLNATRPGKELRCNRCKIGCDFCFNMGTTYDTWPMCRGDRAFRNCSAMCSKLGRRSDIKFAEHDEDPRLEDEIIEIANVILKHGNHRNADTMNKMQQHLGNLLKWFQGDVRRFAEKSQVMSYIQKHRKWMVEQKITASTQKKLVMSVIWTLNLVSDFFGDQNTANNFAKGVDQVLHSLRDPVTKRFLTGGKKNITAQMIANNSANYIPYPKLVQRAKVTCVYVN